MQVVPPEILTQIYNDLPLEDIFTCMFVCHAWHTPAKRKFYDSIEFTTSISVNLFKKCMRHSRRLPTLPAPGLFVREIFFKSDVRGRDKTKLTISKEHIYALARFCPHVEIIGCSSNLTEVVHSALLSLPYKLPRLRQIPYEGHLYFDCALKFCHSLDKLHIERWPYDYRYLRSFTNLSQLDIVKSPLKDMRMIFDILNVCPQIVEARASVMDDPSTEIRLLEEQHQFCLERLHIDIVTGRLSHISAVNDMVKKMEYLKDFELLACDILDVTEPNHQAVEDFAALIQNTQHLENVNITVYGEDHNKLRETAFKYIESVFQPTEKEWYISLMITHTQPGHRSPESLKYELSKENNEKIISVLMPDIELEDRELQMSYVKRFAPHVNELIISYEGVPLNQKGCDYLLENVIENCQQLQSLTLTCGYYNGWVCKRINTNIYRISLIASFLSRSFFPTLSRVCPYLKRLEIYRCHTPITDNIMYYYMPEINLEEIEFNLDQFKLGSFFEKSSMILKVILKSRQKILYYYTNYEHLYMTQLTPLEGEEHINSQKSLCVLMVFGDIQKIRATYIGIPGIEIDTNVTDPRF